MSQPQISIPMPMAMAMAIFVDGDNFSPNGLKQVFEKVSEWCPHARVIVKKVYGDFTEGNMEIWRDVCVDYNLQTIQCWRRHQKNTVDMKMVCDIHELIYSKPDIQTYVLCTGDRDFIEIIQRIHFHGKEVIGLSTNRKGTSKAFQFECDQFHFIQVDEVKPVPASVSTQLPITQSNPVPVPVSMPQPKPAPVPVSTQLPITQRKPKVSTKTKTTLVKKAPVPVLPTKKQAPVSVPMPAPAPPKKASPLPLPTEPKLTRAERRQLKRLLTEISNKEASSPPSPAQRLRTNVFTQDFMDNVDDNYVFEEMTTPCNLLLPSGEPRRLNTSSDSDTD